VNVSKPAVVVDKDGTNKADSKSVSMYTPCFLPTKASHNLRIGTDYPSGEGPLSPITSSPSPPYQSVQYYQLVGTDKHSSKYTSTIASASTSRTRKIT
jgi:hypothetical protein